MRSDNSRKLLRISVGELAERAAPRAIRAAPAAGARLAAGAAEHRAWRAGVEAAGERERFTGELPVAWTTSLDGWEARVEGRIDGLWRDGGAWVVEEVKTVILPPDRFDGGALRELVERGEAFLEYRFQLEIYLFIARAGDPRSPAAGGEVRGRLVFRNLAEPDPGRREAAVEVLPDIEEVRRRVERELRGVIAELEAGEERRRRAGEAAGELPFPFPAYRAGQREIEEAAAETLAAGEFLLLSAPAGIGKTAAVMRAALAHSLPRGLKVFWATAKTTQQRVAAATFGLLQERFRERSGETAPGPPPFRAAVLRAREKICPTLAEGGTIFCHERHCRFARDYGRKLAAGQVLESLREIPLLEPQVFWDRGLEAEACPYEISLEAALEADLVICDYNYVFDPRSALRRFALEELAAGAVLVIDEAHNLHSRGREHWSPAVSARSVIALGEWAAWRGGALSAAVEDWRRRFLDMLNASMPEGAEEGEGAEAFPVELDRALIDGLAEDLEAVRVRRLLEPGEVGPAGADDPIERLAIEMRRLAAALELREQGAPIAAVIDRAGGGPRLRLVCLDPSRPLGERIRSFRSAIAMSATLEPIEFFRDVLGFPPERTRAASFPSPFPRENRRVLIDPGFATTFRRRSREAERIARTADAIAALRRGNYLVFLSSHGYLEEVAAFIDPLRLGEDVLVQPRGAGEEERDRILALLREPGSARILYAVQGGIFAEGVDYPGEMAVGVIIVGPGLPRYDYESELIRGHFEERCQMGFEHAYLYPGMHRVIQAAGRLIRGPEDEGIVVLLGERFAESRYARLLPADWYRSSPGELVTADLLGDIRKFWEGRLPPGKG